MITDVSITLTPRYTVTVPKISLSVPGHSISQDLTVTQRIDFKFTAPMGWLEVRFENKPALDPDMAVIIDQIDFFGISDPRFVWAGIYSPQYPEPWFSQQNPAPMAQLPGQNYLGWNGVWRLDFSVPVFTWMHRTMNLGWIYH